MYDKYSGMFIASKREQFLIETIPPNAIALVSHNIPVMMKVIPEVFKFVGHIAGPEAIEQEGTFFHIGCVRPNCGVTWATTFYDTVSGHKVSWSVLLNGSADAKFEMIIGDTFELTQGKKQKIMNGIHSSFYCTRMQNLK